MDNKVKIAKHNQKASKGEKSYFLKMNHFGDKLNTEIVSSMFGYRRDLKKAPAFNEKKMLGASFISPGITHLLTRSYFSLFTSTVPD
jgi:hypothetical protein